MTAALVSLRRAAGRSGMLLTLLAGHACAGLFVGNLASGLTEIGDSSIRRYALFVYRLFEVLVLRNPPLRLAVLALALLLLVRVLRGLPIRQGLDVLGAFLCLRCLLQFLLLNLLLLSPLRAGGLLLGQLVLFLPVITVAFGWLYWRLDTGARAQGRVHIRFEEETALAPFDYFLASARSLLQFEPTGATAVTRLMQSLFLLHGVVMLDLVALTLSRAIGLASGGS